VYFFNYKHSEIRIFRYMNKVMRKYVRCRLCREMFEVPESFGHYHGICDYCKLERGDEETDCYAYMRNSAGLRITAGFGMVIH